MYWCYTYLCGIFRCFIHLVHCTVCRSWDLRDWLREVVWDSRPMGVMYYIQPPDKYRNILWWLIWYSARCGHASSVLLRLSYVASWTTTDERYFVFVKWTCMGTWTEQWKEGLLWHLETSGGSGDSTLYNVGTDIDWKWVWFHFWRLEADLETMPYRYWCRLWMSMFSFTHSKLTRSLTPLQCDLTWVWFVVERTVLVW